MIKIFYENIFISDLITNKSMTIDEMLELTDFDEQAFKAKHGFEALDPSDFRAVYFELETSLPSVDIEVEPLKDIDGSDMSFRFKRLPIAEHLTLFLFDSGQATLEYDGNELTTFYWNDDVEQIVSRVDDVSVSEFFEVIATA